MCFVLDSRGNVSTVFAAGLSMLLALAGMMIDYAVAVHRGRTIQVAADVAVLAGTKAANEARALGREDWKSIGIAEAKRFLTVNLPPASDYKVLEFSPDFTLDDRAMVGSATVSGLAYTSLMKIFGYDSIALSLRTAASVTPANFVDIHFVIDVSASMGIGAERSDQEKMNARSMQLYNEPCAFACHFPMVVQQNHTPSAAHSVGATLRIDVVREAIKAVISDIQQQSATQNRTRVALYTIGNDLAELALPSSDMNAISSKADAIDLSSQPYNGGSLLSYSLKRLAAKLPTAGDGSSRNKPRSFVVLLTDGIDDSIEMIPVSSGGRNYYRTVSNYPTNWFTNNPSRQLAAGASYFQAFNPSACSELKAKGYRFYSAQIAYNAEVGFRAGDMPKINFIKNELTEPLRKSFSTCASNPATDHVVAQTSSQIRPLLKKVVAEILESAALRLTN